MLSLYLAAFSNHQVMGPDHRSDIDYRNNAGFISNCVTQIDSIGLCQKEGWHRRKISTSWYKGANVARDVSKQPQKYENRESMYKDCEGMRIAKVRGSRVYKNREYRARESASSAILYPSLTIRFFSILIIIIDILIVHSIQPY